jgi:putative nucleotidyltransferase with HDIG domain
MTQPTQATPRNSPSDFQGILERIEATLSGKLRYYDSELHGLSHLREVSLLAGQIATEAGADVETAMVGGFLHDCGRMNDGGGNQHATDSAELAEPVLKERFPHLDAKRVLEAIRRHADGLTTNDPIAGAVWDADRLTLTRLGRPVREDLLSTEAGKRMAREDNFRPDKGNDHGTR